jgi:2-dehydropantoate 2-reductase
MKIAILGAGAMGSLFGSMLAQTPNDVTLIDVWHENVAAINTQGLQVEDKEGATRTIHATARRDPQRVGVCDLVIVFVKCYDTEMAVRSAAPMIDSNTLVLSLQNGWGNGPTIANIVGAERVLLGVTYHSATMLQPGHIYHAGRGRSVLGEMVARDTSRVQRVAQVFAGAGIDVEVARDVRKEIWAKLCLNVCTLPTSALLRFSAGELGKHQGTLDLMQALLEETVAVAQAQGIALDREERWDSILGVLERAVGAKASMLQDVEKRRRTEIDVINGAVVEAGARLGISTPYNQSMVWMIRALQETFGGLSL